MKLKILIAFIFCALVPNFSFASFPVQNTPELSNSIESASQIETVVSEEEVNYSSSFSAVMSNEKSQGIALVLALTLGLLAAHRWYLGSPWPVNVLFIMSFGGVGLWLLIDIIRICTGGMNPKGRYKKSFF